MSTYPEPELARHVYFEATAMIIGLIDLGLAFEMRPATRRDYQAILEEFKGVSDLASRCEITRQAGSR